MIDKEKFIEYVDMMHRQNLNGREDFIEAFQMGIEAAYEEREELVKKSDSLPCVSETHKCKFYVNADWTYLKCECGKRIKPHSR